MKTHIRLLQRILLAVLFVASVSVAQDEKFDHFSTGFVLDGAHANATCESCHVGATFSSTQSRCESCHSPGGLVRASSKPAQSTAHL